MTFPAAITREFGNNLRLISLTQVDEETQVYVFHRRYASLGRDENVCFAHEVRVAVVSRDKLRSSIIA